MSINENNVHAYLYHVGLEAVIDDAEEALNVALPNTPKATEEFDPPEFELWMLLKRKAIEKLRYLHRLSMYGSFIGTKVNLPTDKTTPMALDILGTHEDGLFVLELKVAKAAERNAFTELFAYSNYIAGLFPGSGAKDILNILVAPISAKITKQAYLYDLLISDRNVILYIPRLPDGTPESLRLSLYMPNDEDFQQFTNKLLSHDAMSCVVASFPDLPGWIEYSKDDPEVLPDYTRAALEKLSSYAAQLIEQDGLHGFCYIRKRWHGVQMGIVGEARSELIICAVNPFQHAVQEKVTLITEQIEFANRSIFCEAPTLGFSGRLSRIANKSIKECIEVDHPIELEFPYWGGMMYEMVETVFTDNIGFRPTGMLREAYVENIAALRRHNKANPKHAVDVARIQINDIVNWFRAWEFMSACGFTSDEEA
jgi:hypothetical protein